MSEVATAELGLALTDATDNNGGGFNVFSSLRDGAGSEEFLSGVSNIGKEVDADTDEVASSLDLVAVAGGKAELDTVMHDKGESKETPVRTNPEQCQKYGTIACIGCIFAQDCEDRQAAMMEKNNNLQPEEQLSTLEQLLREDEAPGEIVWAQVVPETDEVGDLGQTEEVPQAVSPNVMEAALDGENVTEEDDGSKEQTSTVHDEEDVKVVETTVKVVKDAGVDDYVAKPQATNPILDEPAEMSEQLTPEDTVVLPTLMAVETKPVMPVADKVPSRETPLANTMVDHAGDYDNSHHAVRESEEKSALPVAEQESSVQMPDTPVNVPMENAKHETPTKELVAMEVSVPVKEQPDQPAVMTSPIQDYVEYSEEVSSVGEEPAVDHNSTQPVVDMPVVHEVVEVVPTESAAIEPEAPTPIIPVETVVDENELWTDPPQDGSQEVAVDQIVYEGQTSPVEQLDDAVIEENLHVNDEEVWAEEDVVFFVEQSSVAEPEAPLAEAVTAGPLTEATIVTSEEIDEPEVVVADEVEIEPVELLDSIQAASVPEITKDDHGSVERSMVPVSSAIESVSDITLDDMPVQVSEEYGLPCEKRDNVITTTPEGNDVWPGGNELEAMAMDGSDAEQSGDLSEEREEPVVINRVAEMAETELSEQDDLAADDAVDGYDYGSEVNVADDFLIVKHHPSLGLWTDDSRLNPEEEATATVQPGADDASLVSRLVGVLVVAMCVARGRRARAIVSSR